MIEDCGNAGQKDGENLAAASLTPRLTALGNGLTWDHRPSAGVNVAGWVRLLRL